MPHCSSLPLLSPLTGTIKSAGTILVLDKGRIVESGPFEELDRPGTRFRTLMAAQLEASAPNPVEEGEGDGEGQGEEGAAALAAREPDVEHIRNVGRQ